MALREEFPRKIKRTSQSITGIRRFKCTWEERKYVTPRIGDQFPDEEMLFVEGVEEEQTGRPGDDPQVPTMCNLVVRYSTRTPYRPIRTTDISMESLETTAFRTWQIAGTKSTMRASIPYGIMDHTYEAVTWVDPRGIMWQLKNCVNGFPWEGFNRGCVLYLGGQVRDEYTNLGEPAWRVRHKFWVRGFDWNMQWREGRQARWPEGHRQAGELKWDDDTGNPIMVDGAPGISGWDWLKPYIYNYANFNQLYLVR